MRPVREVGDRLGYVHIVAHHRDHLRSGHPGFRRVLRRAGRHRPPRPANLRVDLLRRAGAGVSNDLAIWPRLWDDGFDVAVKAREVVTAGITRARAAAVR